MFQMAESGAELECIVHYDSKDGKYTKIKHISDVNKETIFAAKQLREQLGGANHHEKQCLSVPKDIDPDRHGIHRETCYKKFTLILSSHKIDPSQCSSTSDSRPKRAKSSGASSHVYPKECNFCKKYRVKRKQQHYLPITITTEQAANTLKQAAEANEDQSLFYEIKDIDLLLILTFYDKDIGKGIQIS